MRILILVYLVALLLLSGGVNSETLADLLWQFKQCVNETDTSKSIFTDTAAMLWLNLSQHKVVTMAGYLPKSTDISKVYDSTIYPLPGDFHALNQPGAVLAWDGYQWLPVFFNPGLAVDTNAANFDLVWQHADSAYIILRGRFLTGGQTIKVEYFARAPDMVARTDSCYVPSHLHVYIIEEAISYYERAKRNYAGYQLLNQVVRIDLGVLNPQTGRQ